MKKKYLFLGAACLLLLLGYIGAEGHTTNVRKEKQVIQKIVAKEREIPKEDSIMVDKISVEGVKNSMIWIKKGETKRLKGVVVPTNATHPELHFKSSAPKLVTVSKEGVLEAKKTGTAKVIIQATDGSHKEISITVNVLPKETVVYKQGFYYHNISNALKKKMEGKSYIKNKHISYKDLRYIKVKYYNFQGKVKTGEIIVNKKIAQDTVEIFYALYKKKYPIEKMKLIDAYDGNDEKSMADNNTSAFNYRTVAGTKRLSRHAYGMAIDINPRINPYITKNGANIAPENGKLYAQRNVKKCKGKYKKYMIQKNDFICKLLKEHGFTWGGDWNLVKDYQHFEKK